MKYTLATAALLSIISKNDVVNAINSKSSSDLQSHNQESLDAYAEQGRFLGSDGKPINLAQTQGHARIELTKIKKYDAPIDITNLQLLECDKIAKDNKQSPQSLLEKQASQTQKVTVDTTLFDEVTHCPINKDGQPITSHIQQTNLEDNAYVSDMYVGNPPQKVRALFDTGSTNTWILNAKTALSGHKEKEFAYDDQKSKTNHKTEQKAIIQFGSGALAGHFYKDDIRLGTCDGSKSNGQIHISQQKFGNVEKQKTIFTGSNFESIVGMAYPALAEKNVKPVFDEMMDQKLLKNNIFSFYLTSKQAEGAGLKSDMTFGYYDKEKFKGDMNWNDVKYKYMYGVKLDDILFNGKSTDVCKNRPENKPCLITFDSGTSLMSVPKFATKNFVEHGIPTSQFVKRCKSAKEFGDMSLVIGGKQYTLNNDEWMFPEQKPSLSQGGNTMKFNMGPLGPQIMTQISSDSEIWDENRPNDEDAWAQTEADVERHHKTHLEQNEEKGGSGDMACASTIMTMDISKEMFLVGDVFMRKFYTVFDRDNDRVGLAEAVTNDKIKALSQN